VTGSPGRLGTPPPDRQDDVPSPCASTEPVVVDARGLLCPAPVIALAKAARALPAGSRVTVLATDPAARADVPAWARMRGHQVLETTEDGEHLVLTVLLGPGAAP